MLYPSSSSHDIVTVQGWECYNLNVIDANGVQNETAHNTLCLFLFMSLWNKTFDLPREHFSLLATSSETHPTLSGASRCPGPLCPRRTLPQSPSLGRLTPQAAGRRTHSPPSTPGSSISCNWLHSVLHSVHCTTHSVLHTVYTVLHTVYYTQCTTHIVLHTLYTVRHTL